MAKSLVHLILAVVCWSSFYGGLAILGVGSDTRQPVVRELQPEKHGGCGRARRTHARPQPDQQSLAGFEEALESSDFPTEIGIALRAVYMHHSRRNGDEYALGRIRELLGRNRSVAELDVTRESVSFVVGQGLTYVVRL